MITGYRYTEVILSYAAIARIDAAKAINHYVDVTNKYYSFAFTRRQLTKHQAIGRIRLQISLDVSILR